MTRAIWNSPSGKSLMVPRHELENWLWAPSQRTRTTTTAATKYDVNLRIICPAFYSSSGQECGSLILSRNPLFQTGTIGRHAAFISCRQILRFLGIHADVVELRTLRPRFKDHFPARVVKPQKSQGIVRKKQRHARPVFQQRNPLKPLRYRNPKKIQDRGRCIDQTGAEVNACLIPNQARRRNDVWDANVLIVDEEGMPIVSFVLAEGFSMVAEDDKHG